MRRNLFTKCSKILSFKNIREILISLIIIMVFFIFVGCETEKIKYSEYSDKENKDLNCIELHYEGITYRPYGILTGILTPNRFKGKQIGIRESNPDSKIYEVNGYDPHEWILEYLDVFMGGGNTLLKSIKVTEIPKELERFKEYYF